MVAERQQTSVSNLIHIGPEYLWQANTALPLTAFCKLPISKTPQLKDQGLNW